MFTRSTTAESWMFESALVASGPAALLFMREPRLAFVAFLGSDRDILLLIARVLVLERSCTPLTLVNLPLPSYGDVSLLRKPEPQLAPQDVRESSQALDGRISGRVHDLRNPRLGDIQPFSQFSLSYTH